MRTIPSRAVGLMSRSAFRVSVQVFAHDCGVIGMDVIPRNEGLPMYTYEGQLLYQAGKILAATWRMVYNRRRWIRSWLLLTNNARLKSTCSEGRCCLSGGDRGFHEHAMERVLFQGGSIPRELTCNLKIRKSLGPRVHLLQIDKCQNVKIGDILLFDKFIYFESRTESPIRGYYSHCQPKLMSISKTLDIHSHAGLMSSDNILFYSIKTRQESALVVVSARWEAQHLTQRRRVQNHRELA